MTFELRQLRHLLAVEQQGSFGRAAAALRMTQPALSRSIQSLEHQLGSVLFERSKSGTTLTDVGRLLVHRAREIVNAADELDRELIQPRVPGAGQVTVGAGPFPGETIVPVAISQFIASHPLIRVKVLVRDWDELLRRLKNREIDFFVGETSTLVDEPELEVEPLGVQPTYFVARRGHPLARRAIVKTEQVFNHPLALLNRIPPRALQPLLEVRQRGAPSRTPRPLPAVEVGNLAALKRIVQGSDAIAALSLQCIAPELANGSLVPIATESWMRLGYGIVRLKGQPPAAPVAALCALLRDVEAASAREEAKLASRHVPPGLMPARSR